jgi:hypothetical protein
MAFPSRHDVELHEGRLAARSGVSVGRANRNALLQGEHVPQLRVLLEGILKPLLGRARVAEHVGDTLGEELFDEGVASG